MSNENVRRRILGAILGYALSFGFWLGGGGGWKLLLTLDLPIQPAERQTSIRWALETGLIWVRRA